MKTFSSVYAGSAVPGSLEFGEGGPSGASFIPRHTPSNSCIDPTQPCLPPPPLTLCTQPWLSALGFKLGTGLLQFCREIALKRLKSQRWGLLTSQQSVGSPSCHFGAGGGQPQQWFPHRSLSAAMVWWGVGLARSKDQLRSH